MCRNVCRVSEATVKRPYNDQRTRKKYKKYKKKAGNDLPLPAFLCSLDFHYHYLLRLAIVAIMAAMLERLLPMLMVSATVILRFILDGTTISQPG